MYVLKSVQLDFLNRGTFRVTCLLVVGLTFTFVTTMSWSAIPGEVLMSSNGVWFEVRKKSMTSLPLVGSLTICTKKGDEFFIDVKKAQPRYH